jgi:hypothetical protein
MITAEIIIYQIQRRLIVGTPEIENGLAAPPSQQEPLRSTPSLLLGPASQEKRPTHLREPSLRAMYGKPWRNGTAIIDGLMP